MKIPLNFARLGKINEAVGLLLVILGGAGLSNDPFRKLIASGVTKINCHMVPADAAGADIRERSRRFPFAGPIVVAVVWREWAAHLAKPESAGEQS